MHKSIAWGLRGMTASLLLAGLLNSSGLFVESFPAVAPEVDVTSHTTNRFTSEQEHYAAYVSRVYGISHDRSSRIVNIVWSCAEENDVDPLLVLAVISTESSFRMNAVSSAGAVGLMQVMPNVHRELVQDIARGVGKHGYSSRDALRDPVVNIEAGIRVLKMYQEMSDGDLRETLLRYNGSLRHTKTVYDKLVLNHFKKLSSSI